MFIMIAKQNRKEKMNNEGIMKLTQVKSQQVKCIMVYLKSLKIGSKAENIQVSLIMVKNLILILENSIMICLREFIDYNQDMEFIQRIAMLELHGIKHGVIILIRIQMHPQKMF